MFNHKSAISGDAGESIEPKMVMTPVRLDHDQAETWMFHQKNGSN